MFPLWEAAGREGRAWDGHRLLPVQVPKRGAMTYNLHVADCRCAMTTQAQCEICGAFVVLYKCKIRCPNCGYTRDCSDP
jgi:hypothetical protein